MLRASHDRKYAFTLLAVAAGVLVAGIALRPARPSEKKQPQQAPGELERLQQLTEQRRLRDLSTYLTNAANGVASSLVYLNSTGSSGVVWGSRDEILAPRRAAVPFAIMAAKDPEAVMPAFRTSAPPTPGAWVLAVAKNRDHEIVFAHGLYQGHAASRCGSFPYDAIESSAPLSSALVGGGLFTLQGGLLGFIGTCGDRTTVISISTIANFLKRPITLNDRLASVHGMTVHASGEDVRVVAVWAGSAAEAAGLQPGDRLNTVDGTKVSSVEDLGALPGEPEEDHRIEVQRGRRKLSLRLRPVPPHPETAAASTTGMTLGPGVNERELAVLTVAPDSPAERAGILKGDLLRRIGRTAVADAGAAARALQSANGRPVVLRLERDGKELEVLLAP
jgi:S1-C subfamily serine protease